MRRILFAAVVAAIALSACSGSSGPSQAQLTAEKAWSHGEGGKALNTVAAYLRGINTNALVSFGIGGELSIAAAIASAYPPPIDGSTYVKVMHDYGTAGADIADKNPPDVNGFIAKVDAAGALLTSVKPPWGSSLPGGKNF